MAKGLALIPELALHSSTCSSAIAIATAAAVGQGISQGWSRWAGQVLAREWMQKPLFAQERLSGTSLLTVSDPPYGLKYVKVRDAATTMSPMCRLAKSLCTCSFIHLHLAV